LGFIIHLRIESNDCMTNQNPTSPSENSEIVSDVIATNNRSNRKKIKKKIRSSSKTGDSKSEKRRRLLAVVKFIVFSIYGLLMFQSMSKMKTDLLNESLGFNLMALVWLYLLSLIKNSKGKSNFKVARVWLYSHIGILALHAVIVFWMGNEINPNDQNTPRVQVEKAPSAPVKKYDPTGGDQNAE